MILTYSTIPRSSTGFGNLWLAGPFRLMQGCEAGLKWCWFAHAGPWAQLRLWLSLCCCSSVVLGSARRAELSLCAQVGEESSSQRPHSDTQGDEAGLDMSGVPSPPQYDSLVEGELCGIGVGLGAEPGGCCPRNRNSPFCALKETALEICPSFRANCWLP